MKHLLGNFYEKDANKRLFDKLGDIGIKPIFFNTVGYNEAERVYQEEDGTNILTNISGTQVREAFTNDNKLPEWFIRTDIQDVIISEKKSGERIFV